MVRQAPQHVLSDVAMCQAESWAVAPALEQDAQECRPMTAFAQLVCTSWEPCKGSC